MLCWGGKRLWKKWQIRLYRIELVRKKNYNKNTIAKQNTNIKKKKTLNNNFLYIPLYCRTHTRHTIENPSALFMNVVVRMALRTAEKHNSSFFHSYTQFCERRRNTHNIYGWTVWWTKLNKNNNQPTKNNVHRKLFYFSHTHTYITIHFGLFSGVCDTFFFSLLLFVLVFLSFLFFFFLCLMQNCLVDVFKGVDFFYTY